jgi:hypothetical protein
LKLSSTNSLSTCATVATTDVTVAEARYELETLVEPY